MTTHRSRKAHRAARTSRRSNVGYFETLESRLLLTAEGTLFNFSQSYDTFGLGGTISAQIDWGDGTSSAATIRNAPQESRLRIRFDYSLDTSGFFNSQSRRDLLQAAADSITAKLTDNLTAIRKTTGNTWRANFQHPGTGASLTYVDMTIEANELVVFAGARNLNGTTLGFASRGGTGGTFSTQAALDNVRSRGQSGALKDVPTDFGPWGGSISFDTSTRWHFGNTTQGLDTNEFDFMTIAQHEIMHILGFGTSPSFDALIVNGKFTGTNTQRVAGISPIPMPNADHFDGIIKVDGRSILMDQGTSVGERDLPTRVDFAALQDIGWVLAANQITATGTHTYGDNGDLSGSLKIRGSRYGEITYPVSIKTTNVAPTLTKPINVTQVIGAPLSLPRVGLFSDPGYGFSRLTPPTSETFTYSINWGDGSAIDTGKATVTRVGNEGQPTIGEFGGVHTYSEPGSYKVTLTVTDDDGGRATQEFTANITGMPELTLTTNRTSFSENAGKNAATLTVSRSGFSTNVPLVVTLGWDNTSRISIPKTVVIPAGATSTTAAIDAIDNTLLDGDLSFRVTATANNVQSDPVSLRILDHETLVVMTSLAMFPENAGQGASTITVRRTNTDINEPITVSLTSNDTSELSVPASVTIPAGETSVTVGINAVDDNLFDGSQPVLVQIQSPGYQDAQIAFVITDYQPIRMAAPPNVVLHEEIEQQNSTDIVVSIRSPAPAGGVLVNLTSSPVGQLSHPAMVRIEAGETSTVVRIQVVDDLAPQGSRTVEFRASGLALEPTSVDIALTDDDESIWTNMENVFDVDGDGSLSPLDALALVNSINIKGTRLLNPESDADEPFVDPNVDGWITPLDALFVINELNRRLRD